MVKKVLFILQIIFFYTISNFAQGISARAFTDTTAYTVGDYINYTIKVQNDKNVKVFAPVVKDSLQNLDIIKIDKPVVSQKDGKELTTFKYILSKYDSAGVTIPQIPVKYKTAKDTAIQTVYTNPVSFTVRTLKVNMKKDIKDVKAPMEIPLNWISILIWALIIFVVLGLLYFLYRKYWKKQPAEVIQRKAPKKPAHVIALHSLSELEEKKLWQNGLIKEYHSSITEIIRRYFEDRFNLPALELTTSESMEILKHRKEAEPILEITHNFLTNADMVKFAKYTPLTSVNEEMMKQAYEIVNKTIPARTIETAKEESNV